MSNSEAELDKIFLSYNKILRRLNLLELKTKHGKEITYVDLKYAIKVMLEKHPSCRWRSKKIRSKRYYILIEGYYWLQYVYFQNEKSLLDADIDFFRARIKLYEELLNVKKEIIFIEAMSYIELEKYFNRKKFTIRKAIKILEKKYNNKFRFEMNNQMYISSKGIELLCKECFKQKYLELLENYKMELTELYIKAGYIYDEFFGRN